MYREHSGGLPKADLEPQAAPPRQYLLHLPIVAVHFVFVVTNKRTEEVWNCRMRPIRTRNEKYFDINNGRYKIESVLEPADGITELSSRDWQGHTLPSYAAGIGFVLPADISMQYHVTLNLFSLEGANKRKLSSVLVKVTTFEEETDLADVQEGKKLECIERPLLKTKPKGILARAKGWKVIRHFQNLLDNGQRVRFEEDMAQVSLFVKRFPQFRDLLSCIQLEESYFYQDQRSVDISQKAVQNARKYHSPNEIFVLCRAKFAETFLCAKAGDFWKARQHLEEASEICNEMAAGQAKAILCYEWAQYFAEKAAYQGELSEQEREDGERYFNGVVQYHHSDQLMKEIGNRLLLRSLLRQLTFYLKTSRRDPPNTETEITHTEIGQAEDLLDKIKRNFLERNGMSKKRRVLLFMYETDLHIRKKDINNALKVCLRGLVLAREAGKASLITGMEARLRMLEPNEDISVEQLLEQWGSEIDERPDSVGLHTENHHLVQIDQLLGNLRTIDDDF